MGEDTSTASGDPYTYTLGRFVSWSEQVGTDDAEMEAFIARANRGIDAAWSKQITRLWDLPDGWQATYSTESYALARACHDLNREGGQ